jgi:hypothetical protein
LKKSEIISSRTHNEEGKRKIVNKILLRAMKRKSHSQTLSEKFSLLFLLRTELHNTEISNLKSDFLVSEFIKYSGIFPLIFFVTSFSVLNMGKNLCML